MEPSQRNRHLGSDFDEYLEEEGVLEEAEAVAAKRVQAHQDSSGVNTQTESVDSGNTAGSIDRGRR